MSQAVTSNQFRLDWRDAVRGLIVSVIGAVLTAVQGSLAMGEITFNWKQIGIVAATTGVAYLLKNFFEPAKVIIPITKIESAELASGETEVKDLANVKDSKP